METEIWCFTFMQRQEGLKNRYLRVRGSFGEAREKVFDAIGVTWAFQYDEEQFEEQIKQYGLTEISLEDAAKIVTLID